LIGLIKKYWHDPVWSKVIAGTILALAAGVGAYFFDWWPSIKGIAQGIIDFLQSQTAVPNWLLGVMAIPMLFGIYVFGYVIWKGYFTNNQTPTWRNYVKDSFFEIHWSWRYSESGQIFDLYSFCPNCDFQIYPRRHLDVWRDFTHISFHCESCGKDLGNFSDDVEQFENKITRHIQRNIRSGEWRNALPSNSK
jgi:hypothetical protein